MKIAQKTNNKNINVVKIVDIDVYEANDMEILKTIIKKLTKGERYFFNFRREDTDILNNDEVIRYRDEIPNHFKQNGQYEIKFSIDKTRFGSIGYLPVNEKTFEQIAIMWKYFYGMSFFSPRSSLSWQEYGKYVEKKRDEMYGFDIVQNNLADSVFIKGHDGDNLIFTYGVSYDKKLIEVIEKFVEMSI